MNNINVEYLFPAPVSMIELDNAISADEITFIKKQDKIVNFSNYSSKNNHLLDCLELKNLKEQLQLHLKNVFEKIYCPTNDVEIYITQSWANFTTKNQSHHKHNHPNSFLSGVYYVDAKDDRIIFCKDDLKELLRIESKSWNIFNSNTWWYPVKTGTLIVFPSYLTHMVDIYLKDTPRISIAFNSFLKGRIGNSEYLTQLNL